MNNEERLTLENQVLRARLRAIANALRPLQHEEIIDVDFQVTQPPPPEQNNDH